jgi:hypothetical protein
MATPAWSDVYLEVLDGRAVLGHHVSDAEGRTANRECGGPARLEVVTRIDS